MYKHRETNEWVESEVTVALSLGLSLYRNFDCVIYYTVKPFRKYPWYDFQPQPSSQGNMPRTCFELTVSQLSTVLLRNKILGYEQKDFSEILIPY